MNKKKIYKIRKVRMRKSPSDIKFNLQALGTDVRTFAIVGQKLHHIFRLKNGNIFSLLYILYYRKCTGNKICLPLLALLYKYTKPRKGIFVYAADIDGIVMAPKYESDVLLRC